MSANLKSIVLMIIAMGCLTLTDMFIKIASQTLPIGQIMIIYGVGALLVFWGWLRIKGESIHLSHLPQSSSDLEKYYDLIAINSMFLALVYVPLSTIGADPSRATIGYRCCSLVSRRAGRSEAYVSYFHWFFCAIY